MSSYTLHLIHLKPPKTIEDFSRAITSLTIPPLLYSQVHKWISQPSASLAPDFLWDILIVQASSDLDPSLKDIIESSWSATIGVTPEWTSTFSRRHEAFDQTDGDIPSLSSSWDELGLAADKGPSHEVEVPLTPDLVYWAKELPHQKAVSMLNLHSYSPGGKERFMEYIQVFTQELGPKSGGVPSLFGAVHEDGWDDIALVQYPNIQSFMALLASEDYQMMDRKYKSGSLRDGGILCVSEIELRN